jgi:hypothetical protein
MILYSFPIASSRAQPAMRKPLFDIVDRFQGGPLLAGGALACIPSQ